VPEPTTIIGRKILTPSLVSDIR